VWVFWWDVWLAWVQSLLVLGSYWVQATAKGLVLWTVSNWVSGWESRLGCALRSVMHWELVFGWAASLARQSEWVSVWGSASSQLH
jgi:hypothetical protein